MKKILSLVLLTAAFGTVLAPVHAQTTTPPPAAQPNPPPADIIVKRNGDDIAAQIVEVTPDVIKYRRVDNPQGPLFTLYRAEVFMIRYANGTKDVFNGPRPATPPMPPATDRVPPSATYSSPPPPPKMTAEDTVFAHVAAGGPRIGVTYIGPGKLRNRLRDDYDATYFISQIGWQFEQRLFSLPQGPTGLVEFVPLIGGLEQGLFLPSISGILGIRGRTGLEVGIGPNLSLAGAGLVLAAGHTVQGRFINVPINFAVVPSREGARFSFLLGFTYRTQAH
ncbi:MAG: hypothetical protein H7330_05610 [Hymenobacteraceae bacterium]|nr:hypothetical protein [Hymenobacteraceae bacterium]